MALPPARVLSLFSGYGGLDRGLAAALRRHGIAARTVCYVEREASCALALVEAMERGDIDRAPIWTDVTAFDGRPWRGAVDIVAGGFPCQDLSLAGPGAGWDGDRSSLWWQMHRIVGEIRPRLVIAENVSGLLIRERMEAVAGGLALLGYVGQWISLRASDVGAPHRRERVFIVAMADASRARLEERRGERGDDGAQRPSAERGRYADLPPFPPGPDDRAAWASILERWPELAPAVGDTRRE